MIQVLKYLIANEWVATTNITAPTKLSIQAFIVRIRFLSVSQVLIVYIMDKKMF